MPTTSFQQGVNYSGTVDTGLVQATPNANLSLTKTLSVDADAGAQQQVLLMFQGLFGTGPGQIPFGATITSATLTFKTANASATGVELHRMLVDWSGTSTWNTLGNGVQLDGVEAVAGADAVRTNLPLGNTTFDVTSSLTAWLSGAADAAAANLANKGWVLTALGTDGWDLKSSEGGTVPVLTVTYSTGVPDPPVLSLAGNVSQAEGTSGSPSQFVFTVNRTGDTSGALTVDYSVSGSGANPANGADFAGGSLPGGTVNFAAGQQSATIVVNVAADAANESNETFTLSLANATGGGTIGTGTATGTIVNDDASGGILAVRIFQGSTFGGANGSTDPTDITYDWSTGKFYVVDSEVDESPFFANNNLFKLGSSFNPIDALSMRGFTSEPTGVVAWTNSSGQDFLFVCDDDQKLVFKVDVATLNVVNSFSTTSFGAVDPEDLSINPNNGNLFVLSEDNRTIYEVTQSGALVASTKLPTLFTTLEGLEYDWENDQFFVCFGRSPNIYVVNRAGAITQTIDVLKNYPNTGNTGAHPKGLELAPASDGSGKLSLWVTDYGKDQVPDGRVFEIVLDRPATAPAALPPEPAALSAAQVPATFAPESLGHQHAWQVAVRPMEHDFGHRGVEDHGFKSLDHHLNPHSDWYVS